MELEKTKHFCVLPWVHASLLHTGEFSVCCLTWPYLPGERPGEFGVEGARNSDKLRAMRTALVRDEASPYCTHCYEMEKVTSSPRRLANQNFAEEAREILLSKTDTSTAAPLRSLDVRFSNLCNLKCRTCEPRHSTSWQADATALGRPTDTGTLRLGTVAPELESYVHSVLPGIKHLYFAGGEPLLEESHYRLLEKLLELGRSDVILDYNSNFTTLGRRNRDVLSLWKKFETVKVGASLDGSGRQFNYLRKGADWNKVLANYRRLIAETPHVLFYIYSTVSVMNVFHLPVAIGDWIREGLLQWPDQLVLNPLVNPRYFSVTLLNPAERLRLRACYEAFLGNLKANKALRVAIERGLKMILNHVEREPFGQEKDVLRAEFGDFTRKVDRLRGEVFEDAFPELGDLVTCPPTARADSPTLR